MGEWIRELRYSHLTESSNKGNKLLIHVTTWMHLKNMVLSEKPHTVAIYKCLSPCSESFRIG